MRVKTFAAIDVGSYETTMKIFELSGKATMREIDCVSRRLDLGSTTYATGIISKERLDELCKTLREFADLMNACKVDAYRVYGTSAVRETKNTAVVLDQIAQRTGLQMTVLSNSEQRFLDYKSIASKGESFRRIIEEPTAIVDIGGGSIQLSLFDNDTLVSTQNLRLGVLRIQEFITQMKIAPSKMEQVVEEIIGPQLLAYKKLYLKDRTIKNIIVVDDYLSPWAVKLNEKHDGMLQSEDYKELFSVLRSHNQMEAAKKLDMMEERIPLLYISAILSSRIAKLMGASTVWAPGVTLCDGIAYEYGESIRLFREEHDFERDILACAMNISKRYMGSKKRAQTLESIATTIFDSMKKVHGLGKREHLYLCLAAILNDCGKYISLVNIGETAYNIIMATEMIGLSHREREIVANIVLFNHSDFDYQAQEGSVSGLDREALLIIAKLTAILRLASSLDHTHKQKLVDLKATLKDNELRLSAQTSEDTSLELSYFGIKSALFEEVFSVTPVVNLKKPF